MDQIWRRSFGCDAEFDAALGSNGADQRRFLRQRLSRHWRPSGVDKCAVEAVAVTVSTNEDLVSSRESATAGSTSYCALLIFKAAGRGRKQRQWHAAPGDALLFSVAIPLAAASQSLPAITLACGVALAESLRECGIAVQLKWPNDIRIDGCKLGGILTELVADREWAAHARGRCRHQSAYGRRGATRDRAAGDRARCNCSTHAARSRASSGSGCSAVRFSALRRASCRRGSIRFARASIDCSNHAVSSSMCCTTRAGVPPISGRVIEVDRDGRLVIEAEGQRHAISVGDVSVRR